MERDRDAWNPSLSMSRRRRGRVGVAAAATPKSTVGPCGRTAALTFATACLMLAAIPSLAGAHGPVAPIATSYLARIGQLPAGLDAEVVDGDQRLWLRVPPTETIVVLDYRGAPYLRFSPAGVAVNHNSPMYYLNQTPAEVPPSSDGPNLILFAAMLLGDPPRTAARFGLVSPGVVVAGPLSLVALIAGWVTTEVGRQPWVVYRVMRTSEAVTRASGIPVGYGTLAAVYVALAAAVAFVLVRLARAPLESS